MRESEERELLLLNDLKDAIACCCCSASGSVARMDGISAAAPIGFAVCLPDAIPARNSDIACNASVECMGK